jgi:hypothetical protein
MTTLHRLKHFVQDMTRLADAHHGDEPAMLARGRLLLSDLIAHDDWLPPSCATPDPDRYTQYLLHCDPLERFSVVSFVWGPGQRTPVHDHTVWGLVGMLRGAEAETRFTRGPAGTLVSAEAATLRPGRHGLAQYRRHPRGRQRGARRALDQHPRLWRQYRHGPPPRLRPRQRDRQGIRLRLFSRHRAQPVVDAGGNGMSDAAAPAPPLPLFFTNVVGINPDRHSALRLDRGTGYGFAAGAASIPLGLGEFAMAAQHYPIVFAAGPVAAPVALVGLNDLGNLFVDPAGAWRAGAYVPAYLRAWPFVFVQDPARTTTYVAMEQDAACLGTAQGVPLFEDGKPTPAMTEAVQFCASFRDNLAASAAFAAALDAAGLLQEEEATVNFTAGGSTRVRGFKVIRPDKLDQVPDDTFLDWRRRGWLGAAYAHLHSAGNWARLIDLAACRPRT